MQSALLSVQRHGALNKTSINRVLASALSQQGYCFPSATSRLHQGSASSVRARSTLAAQPNPYSSALASLAGSSSSFNNSASSLSWAARFNSTSSAVSDDGDKKKPDDDKDSVVQSSSNKQGWILDMGLPSMIPEWRNMFKADTLFTDVSAGLTVGCIAVPLSLAIALASGVPAEVGLVTAAVSGVAGGLMGGTTLAVTGPAAAISLLVVGAVQEHGLEALPFITLACGGLQVASGVTRLGVVAKLVPVSVIAGFTTGVGSLILTGQLPKALGMTAPAGLSPVELLGYLGSNTSLMSPSSAALAVGTSAAMFFLPRLHPKVPSALVAVGGATLATHGLGLDVSLIGEIPSGLQAFQFGIPMLPSVDSLPSLCATTLLIYSMTSVESLLSCAALEKMKKTTYKHNPDQELIGQGLANVGSALFMGMPVTSVIARSSLNVRLNAHSRLPALVQAGFVFSSVVFFSDKIAMIPMPALSGVLITTGLGMLNPAEFKHCYSVQKMDALPFAVTIGGMLSFGLAEGIGLGCASAVALNYAQASGGMAMMSAEEATTSMLALQPLTNTTDAGANLQHARGVHTAVRPSDSSSDAGAPALDPAIKIGNHSSVWKLHGPINFMSMFEIDDLAKAIQDHRDTTAVPLETIVLDCQNVTSVEFTGVEELVNRMIEVADDTPIQMININDDIENALDQCDPKQQIARFPALI